MLERLVAAGLVSRLVSLEPLRIHGGTSLSDPSEGEPRVYTNGFAITQVGNSEYEVATTSKVGYALDQTHYSTLAGAVQAIVEVYHG
jgi:hypothetical protein